MRYPNSLIQYDFSDAIPGRSLVRSKAPGRMYDKDAGPLYAIGGKGAVLYDVDGNEFIDMVCGLGAISLGYDNDSKHESRGFTRGCGVLSLPSRAESVAAEQVLQHVAPWASSIRFTKTGSEATHAAYRIAKRATGRAWVLMGDWAYHGWHEWCEKRPDGRPESFHTQLYKHGQNLDETMQHGVHPLNVDGSEVAAVFIEPHRWETVDVNWLLSVRQWCDKVGALLIFDEMIFGGRWALGGASEYFKVIPDMACYGKAIGNGDAVACVVGGEILQEHGQIVSGTYSGDTVGLEAVISTLEVYESEPVIETLWHRGQQLQQGLQAALAFHPTAGATLKGTPVHQQLRFESSRRQMEFGAEMAARGVLWHPDVVNVCYAHSAEQINDVVIAATESLGLIARYGAGNQV